MNAKTLEAITRHGNALLAAFPNATERDPVTLCKKLRRIENAVYKPIYAACCVDGSERAESAIELATKKTVALLGMDEAQSEAFFINTDPRGHSLKMEDEWTKAHNNPLFMAGRGELHITTDWGGYGILAPDLTDND